MPRAAAACVSAPPARVPTRFEGPVRPGLGDRPAERTIGEPDQHADAGGRAVLARAAEKRLWLPLWRRGPAKPNRESLI